MQLSTKLATSTFFFCLLISNLSNDSIAQQIYDRVGPQVRPPQISQITSSIVPNDEQKRLGLVTISVAPSPGNQTGGSCSGTLLNRYWVLTAHHCIAAYAPIVVQVNGMPVATTQELTTTVMPGTVTVTAAWSSTRATPTRFATFTSVGRVRNYTDTTGLDIALIFLGSGDFGPVATNWADKLWDGSWTFSDGYQDVYGRGRSRFALTDSAGTDWPTLNDGQYRSVKSVTPGGGTKRYYFIGAAFMGGDSGGPSFINIRTTAGIKTYLSGVHDFGIDLQYLGQRNKFTPPGPWAWVTYASGADQSVELISESIRDVVSEEPKPQPQFIGEFGPVAPASQTPFRLYYVPRNGNVLQQDFKWQPQQVRIRDAQISILRPAPVSTARLVNSGWQLAVDIAGAGGNRFFVRNQAGQVLWYHHDGAEQGATRWTGPKIVGTGFESFRQVFGGGDGIMYAIAQNGDLYWYTNDSFRDGESGLACSEISRRGLSGSFASPCLTSINKGWRGPNVVGNGWGGFRHVFSAGKGIIYAVRQDGVLMWYRHDGYRTGDYRWPDPVEVGEGWANFSHIVSVGEGIILALKPDGDLTWYRHKTWNATPSARNYGEWERPITVTRGLTDVAIMSTPAAETPLGPN